MVKKGVHSISTLLALCFIDAYFIINNYRWIVIVKRQMVEKQKKK